MKLTKIIIENYRQHRELEQDLSGSIIAIIGQNGVGKSNLLGAIQFALTGDIPNEKKSSLLSWGAKSGYVTLEFEHAGVEGSITRSIQSSSAELKYGDNTYSTITAINEALYDQIGIDKDLAKQAIFVRQAEIDSILFSDPKVREMAFHRLMGIGDASKIHRIIGEVLSDIGRPDNYIVQINEANDNLNTQKARKLEAESKLNETKLKLNELNISSIDEARNDVNVIRNKATELRDILVLESDISKHQDNHNKLTLERAKLELPLNTEASIIKLDSELTSLRLELITTTEYAKLYTKLRNLATEIKGLSKPALSSSSDDINAKLDEVNEYRSNISKISADKDLYSNLSLALNTSVDFTECPVCGSKLEDSSELQARLRSKLAEIDNELNDSNNKLSLTKSEYDKAKLERDNYEKKYNELLAIYKSDKAKLSEMTKPIQSINDIKAKIDSTSAELSDYRAKLSSATAKDSELNTIKNILTSLSSNLNNKRKKNADLIITRENLDNMIAEIKAKDDNIRIAIDLSTSLAAVEQSIIEIDNNIKRYTSDIEKLKELNNAANDKAKTIEYVKEIRDWFHYTNGPRILAQSVMSRMVIDVNNFLGSFTAPFTLHDTDGANLTCDFHDGRLTPDGEPVDASALSGGQRIQLAVAFRLAAYCMFASELGILVLDEPTVYLDDSNIGRFCDLLVKVKEIAEGMDLQIMLATHERSIIPFCDSVIDLDNTENR